MKSAINIMPPLIPTCHIKKAINHEVINQYYATLIPTLPDGVEGVRHVGQDKQAA
jgi:hypothetical protein